MKPFPKSHAQPETEATKPKLAPHAPSELQLVDVWTLPDDVEEGITIATDRVKSTLELGD